MWDVATKSVRPDNKHDLASLNYFLSQGWEPFAVTWHEPSSAWDYHLRRQVSPHPYVDEG